MLCCKKIKITPLVLSSVLGLFACFEPPAEPLSIGDAAATRPMPPEGERVSLFDLLMAQTRGEDGKIKIPYPFTKLVEYLSQWGKPVQVLVPLGRSLQRHAGLPNPFADPRRLVAFASKPLSETGGKLQDLDLHGRLFIGYVEQSNSLEIMSLLPGRTEFDFQLIENYCSGGADCTPHIKNAVTGECMACHQAGQPIFSTFPWSESNADPIIADLLKHYDADKDGKVDGIPIEQRREDVEDFCHLLTVTTDPDRPDETMTSACYEDLVIYGRSLQLGQMLWDNTAKLCPDLSAPACRRQLLKVLVARSSLSEAINKLNLNDNDLISFAIKTTHFLTDRVLLEGKDLSAMSGKEIADKIIEEHKRDGHLLLQQNNAIFNPLVSRLGFNLNLFEAIGTIRTTLELVGRMLFAGQGRRSIITSQLLEDNKNLDEDIITWLTETTITAEVTTDDASSLRLILGRRAANDEDNIGDDGDNGDNSPFIVVAVAAPNDCDSFAEIRSGCTFGESGQFSLANKKATHLDFEIKAASSPAANVAIPPAAQEEGARLPAATQEYISTLTITFAGETETTKVSLHCSENDEGSSEQICSEDGTNCSIVSTQGIVCTIFDLNADDKAVDRMLESFFQDDTYQPTLLAKEIFKVLGAKVEMVTGLTWTEDDLRIARDQEVARIASMEQEERKRIKDLGDPGLLYCTDCHAKANNVYPFLYATSKEDLCCQLKAIEEKARCYIDIEKKIMPPPASSSKQDFSDATASSTSQYLGAIDCECPDTGKKPKPNLPSFCTDNSAQTEPATKDQNNEPESATNDF